MAKTLAPWTWPGDLATGLYQWHRSACLAPSGRYPMRIRIQHHQFGNQRLGPSLKGVQNVLAQQAQIDLRPRIIAVTPLGLMVEPPDCCLRGINSWIGE
jgi:hypothetical protein